MTKNVGKHVGVPIQIAGEDFNLSLTMLGLDYLDEVYGAGEAMKKFQEMGQKFAAGDIDKESRGVLCEWIRASLIHNQFDETGKNVREIPTVFQIQSSLSIGELMGMASLVLKSYQVSFPQPKEEAGDIDPP